MVDRLNLFFNFVDPQQKQKLFFFIPGPLLLFDESLFQFCQAQGIEFLTVRVYIGLWLAIIGVAVAAFEGSVLVKLFSRFTEDIFSALIVFLYIIESIQKIFFVYEKHPILANYCEFELTSFR